MAHPCKPSKHLPHPACSSLRSSPSTSRDRREARLQPRPRGRLRDVIPVDGAVHLRANHPPAAGSAQASALRRRLPVSPRRSAAPAQQ
eukprot:5309084-Prymnesium_polylepis.2